MQADPKCTQIMLDEEIEEAENYNGTCVDLKAKHERCLNLWKEVNESQNDVENSSKSNHKLPKIEFQKFDGTLKNYISFWGLFKKIHEDPSIFHIDKFQYLLQSTSKESIAREVIELHRINS